LGKQEIVNTGGHIANVGVHGKSKMNNPEFLGDTTALLRHDEIYNPEDGFLMIKKEIIDKM